MIDVIDTIRCFENIRPLAILCTEGGQSGDRTMFTFRNNSLELQLQELPTTINVKFSIDR